MTKNGQVLNFFYDGEGRPAYFTYNNTTYYYVTNLQGDVIAILDSTGTMVARYHYDAFGDLMDIEDIGVSMLSWLNPLRYRGYVYDNETGLYYVGSRYYMPSIRRWISPEPNVYAGGFDSGAGINGYNVFAYCANNPVNYRDSNGESVILALLIGAGIGLATQYVADVAVNLHEGNTFGESLIPRSTLVDYCSAAFSGALAASGVGFGTSVVVNAVLGGTTYLTNCAIEGKAPTLEEFTATTLIGAGAGAIGGKGANAGYKMGMIQTARETLRTLTSPKKIAMYTSKITSTLNEIYKSVRNTVAAGLVSNYLNYNRNYYGSLIDKYLWG